MGKNQKQNGIQTNGILKNIPLACADEMVAVKFLEHLRWGNGDNHHCPRCGDNDVYMVMDRNDSGKRNSDYRWRCRSCGKYYTVRTGTVMEDSRVPARHWCLAFWRVCSSKKGISAKQIQRETGLSYKSALFLMHRVRFALSDMTGCKLTGTVEVDETYIGGKPRRGDKKRKRGRGCPKSIVVGLVQRDGDVRARVIPNVTAKTLKSAILEHVDKKSKIMTDEWPAYRGLNREYIDHQTVHHGRGEYSRGEVFTNTAESFFALLKRGVYGTFHAVSSKHLHRYVSEFEFRWNTRQDDDGDRVSKAILSSEGKRLMYRKPKCLLAG